MENKTLNKLQYFVIIGKPKLKEKLYSLLKENNAHLLDTIYGHGSVSSNILAQAFGLDSEQKRVIISCLVPSENLSNLIQILHEKYQFNKPNTGIAFSVPVEGIMF